MRSAGRSFLLPWLATLFFPACVVEPTPLPVETGSLDSFDGKLIETSPTVIVLVVDDADTAEAAGLRAQVLGALQSGLQSWQDEHWGSCASSDPAEWHPADLRLILARPSAPDDEALLTPIEIPALAWQSQLTLKTEIPPVLAAAASALKQRLAQPADSYRPLHAAKRAVDLLTGARPAEGAAESSFVASLEADTRVRVVIASTRDDQDGATIASLAIASGTSDGGASIQDVALIGPFKGDASCDVSNAGNTRLQAWGGSAGADLTSWPCAAPPAWDELLGFGFADCGYVCNSRPLTVSDDGGAACRIYLDKPDLAPCDASLGHHDPDGKAATVEHGDSAFRRCEIDALAGPDLEACQSTLDCTGCAPGWCLTEVAELASPEACTTGTYRWPFRFLGGSRSPDGAWLHADCKTAAVH